MTVHLNERRETETLYCDIIVVLNIAALLRLLYVVLGEGFGVKYKP